jgi:hypothetical protein
MKQFLLFFGLPRPQPGMEDFVEDFDTLEQAQDEGAYRMSQFGGDCWYQIFDCEIRDIVVYERT